MSADRITAGELRSWGISVPDSIPDCGNIPRSSMIISADNDQSKLEGDILTVGMSVTFTEPFQWIEVPITIVDQGAA